MEGSVDSSFFQICVICRFVHMQYMEGGAYFIDKKTFIEMLKNQYRNGLDFFKYIFSRKGINTCSFYYIS